LVAFSVDDDAMLIWLRDRSARVTSFAKNFLRGHTGSATTSTGTPSPTPPPDSPRSTPGVDAAGYFDVQPGDPRVPDVLGVTQVGVVYTGGKGKIAEHGGANPQDRNVPLVVAGNPVGHHDINTRQVETTQIAPTILTLLGLNPDYLQAVQIEHTATLPVH
jgi:hypothetical protein